MYIYFLYFPSIHPIPLSAIVLHLANNKSILVFFCRIMNHVRIYARMYERIFSRKKKLQV